MSREADFVATLRALATTPAARGLADDAAVIETGGATLVLTHDVLVEGVHFLSADPAGDVAWKLLAVNLSDLAAKGARPLGVLLGFALGDEQWDLSFVAGFERALGAFGVPLLGGDTVTAPRVLGLTAIGQAAGPVPSRNGVRLGDELWVSGTVGDAGAGLAGLEGLGPEHALLVERYRRPQPRIEAGMRLAPLVTAMMDVSDGLLIDAGRMAEASGVELALDLSLLPLSKPYRAVVGDDRAARFTAATAGDDYELLFAAPPEAEGQIAALANALGLPLTRIGTARAGRGLALTDRDEPLALPTRLGWEHG